MKLPWLFVNFLPNTLDCVSIARSQAIVSSWNIERVLYFFPFLLAMSVWLYSWKKIASSIRFVEYFYPRWISFVSYANPLSLSTSGSFRTSLIPLLWQSFVIVEMIFS